MSSPMSMQVETKARISMNERTSRNMRAWTVIINPLISAHLLCKDSRFGKLPVAPVTFRHRVAIDPDLSDIDSVEVGVSL